MSHETIFSLPKSDHSFLVRYQTSPDEHHDHIEAREVASTFGHIVERVATRLISDPVTLSEKRKSRLGKNFKILTQDLATRIRSIRVPEGKTLSRAQVLPHYLQVLEDREEQIDILASEMDKTHNLKLSDKLNLLRESYSQERQNLTLNTKLNYFMDGLLILSRLTLNGIGTDLNIFGNLLPDIKLRERENGNSEITQLDGLFLPHDLKSLSLSSPAEREAFVRDLASKHNNYPDRVPPVLEVPAFLEIKAHFRPRWSIGNLSQNIPPYQMREIMQRIGAAFTHADIAIAPRKIIYLRLRSLAPNSIAILHTGSDFYRLWKNAIQKRLDDLTEENIPDYVHEQSKKQLELFLRFLTSHQAKLTYTREKKTKTDSNNYRQGGFSKFEIKSPGSLKKLANIEVQHESKKKGKRKKNKEIKSEKLFGS